MADRGIPRAWIEGDTPHGPSRPVHESFLLQAQRDPAALALRQWDRRLTYGELARTATALAGRLRAAGVDRGSRVGVCMKRTLSLPVSELAVLIARGAFVPLDLDQPAERLRSAARDADIAVALVDSSGSQVLAGTVARCIMADAEGGDTPPATVAAFGPVAMSDVAYVMYTSGSTGRPKGVIISHGNLAAFALAANQHLGGIRGYRQAAFAAVGFDVSVYEFFSPLICGSSIHLVSEAERADSEKLQRFLQAHRATRVFLPPVLLALLDPGSLPALRELIVGGEACDPRQVERWAVPGQRLFYNWYGPTETTVAVVGIDLSGTWDTPLPIGRPLPGCSIYVLGEDMAICPVGQVGELYVGGPQVGFGYVSSPRENAERFVPDPFAESASQSGRGYLYRTGDLAAWDESGVISFLGRADRQVQIHGRRVEPGEIEAILSGHPRVAQAVVDVSGSGLRAYVTPDDAPSSEELREYCAAWLPRHMVPASVTALARIPMTVNAKIDFAALREFGWAADAEPAAAPDQITGFEHAVVQGWMAVFDGARPGREDDFFLAGGDSLSAMRLAAELRRTTGRQVSAEDMFRGRTVAGIAARVDSAEAAEGSVLPSGSTPVLSPAQRRLWFVEQFASGVPVHNIVMSERITGAVDVTALERALEDVARRQEALRWRLRSAGGVPEVTVTDPPSVTIAVEDVRGRRPHANRSALRALLDAEARTPISLTGGPLWRVRLVRLADAEHVLVITVHHIIFDGWSQAVLYRELSQAYERALGGVAGDPSPGRFTFADYTTWVLDQTNRNGPAATAWWERHLAGAPAVLDLPRDRPRPAVLSFSGSLRGTAIDAGLAADIARLAAAEGATASAVLLAAFSVLLRRLTGEHDQIVGTPVADRGHAEFEHVVGFFIHTLPLRLTVEDDGSFAGHVRRCSGELASAREHADAPLERIVEAIGGNRDLTRNPLFQVMFNIYNFAEPRLELGTATVRPVQAGVPGSLVDLTLYVILHDGGMRLEAAYNTDLYDGPRIDALLDSYQRLLSDLVRYPERSVAAASARPQRTALPDWTAPLPAEVPGSPGLLEQVRAIACDMPDRVAVEETGRTLRYADLVGIADRTAAALREASVRPGDVVAVLAERTAVLPAVLLGVLSAGARWAILDGELPDVALGRRLAAVRPARGRALIRCLRAENAAEPETGWTGPVIDAARLTAAGPAIGPSADAPAASRGYLAFTSGTTGEPQVVDIGEVPLVHFLNWYRATFHLGSDVRSAMLSGVAHDPLLRDIFAPLTCGGTCVVPPRELLRDPSGLLAWLDHAAITVAHMTPQLVRMLAGADQRHTLDSLRLAAVGGDQLTEGDVAALRLIAPHARVVNFYGTTETPQAQAYHELPPQARAAISADTAARRAMPVPVGVGIDGAELLVMSACGQPAAVGELGEVAVRSRYLSNGYVGDHGDRQPFAALPGAGEGSVFRTGDLGRYGPSGAVTLAGRADDQVKVRGFRVELGEVEAALSSHPDVERAAVRVFERDGATVLHAYVVRAASTLAASDVLQHARSLLPPYAVPSGVTMLATLPLSGSGKVDRLRLPPPGGHGPVRHAGYDAPQGHLELLILAIWREVLGVPRIGSNDNFFEIGGHSMAIIEVQSRLKRALGRQIQVVDLFRFPTIKTLAGHLDSGGADSRLFDAEMRGRMRRERAGRSRARAREAGMRHSTAPP